MCSGIRIVNHSAKLHDTVLQFQFFFIADRQLIIWIGDNEHRLESLQYGFPAAELSDATATCLLGALDAPGNDVVTKLSKRYSGFFVI